MYRFSGFTEKANNALNISIFSAQKMGHTYVGSEHIILGLLREKNSIAYNVLKSIGVSEENYYGELLKRLSVGIEGRLSISDFTPRAKKIIEASVAFNNNTVNSLAGTDCILLCLLRSNSSLGTSILKRLGVNLEKVKTKAKSFSYLEYSDVREFQKKTPKLLENFGTDLNEKATIGNIDPLIGRDKELKRLIQILSRRSKNNPCLLGEPGVGKTAIIEGLALKIIQNDVPLCLKNKKIISLSLTNMVAGTRYRGDFEERVKNVLNEVKKDRSIILFIDEIHSIVGAGSAEGSADIANILKPSLTNREIQIIGATTIAEYRKYISKDNALERRFSTITVEEPSNTQTIEIITGVKSKYEDFHNVEISQDAIESAVCLSARYITDRFLPDKAIDLIDEACSKLKLDKTQSRNIYIKKVCNNANLVKNQKQYALRSNDIDSFLDLKKEESVITKDLEENNYFPNFPLDVTLEYDKIGISRPILKKRHIEEVVSMWSGIPVSELTKSDTTKYLHLEKRLKQAVIGQDDAIKSLCASIKRSKVGLNDTERPIGSFLFLGATGVGKTKLCKTLAKELFGHEKDFIRFDMSEFMEKHAISRLIGSPPGYIGHDNGGELTERVKQKPYSIVLFDEIEKAHPDLSNILLQILDEGVLTDSQGRKINFKNTVVIMTSNIGSKTLLSSNNFMGFSENQKNRGRKKEEALAELKKHFSPELLNRIDETIVFNNLTKENMIKITDLLLKEISEKLVKKGIVIKFSDKLTDFIAQKGCTSGYGARVLKKLIRENVENRLADGMLDFSIKNGDTVLFDYDNGIVIKKDFPYAVAGKM